MQAWQRFIRTITTQLGGLSAQSRLLIGSVMVIMVMALFLVAQYASRPGMVELPVGALTTEAQARAVSFLER
ncbi:MAG: hypothetical protein ACYTGG_13900, partial [Planctomycetota bacterium]